MNEKLPYRDPASRWISLCLCASTISAGTVGNRGLTGAHPSSWLLVGNTGCKVNLRCLGRRKKQQREWPDTVTSDCSSGPLLQSELLQQRFDGLEQGRRWCPPENWLKHPRDAPLGY